ncbi:MAG TPA: family 16 glycoside hydrolase [Ktedonobacteraceae bacterium]|nr:family 16 glycoside hydrolase [Ktedonobacteraceae bacterium]
MSSMYPPRNGQTIQSCMRCGLPLLPDVPVCRNCGWYNASLPQPFANGVPNMQGQNPQANYNGFANVGPGYVPPAAPVNAYQPAMNGFAPQGNYYQQPPQPEEQKRGPSVAVILLIVVALLLIIGGGGVAGYFFFFKGQGQGTGTTAITPTAAIVTPSVKPLFGDNFQDNTNKWNLTSTPGQYSVTVGGGQMVLEDDHNKLLWEILPGQTFADFRLDVDARLTKGDKTNGYGVFIRGIASQGVDIGLYYRFELYGDGTFALYKGSLDANGNTISTSVTNNEYIPNAAIKTEGNINHITVIAKGSSMVFMVNGVSVYTYNDSAYKGGEVALFVSNLPNLPPVAQAVFTHLAVFPAS